MAVVIRTPLIIAIFVATLLSTGNADCAAITKSQGELCASKGRSVAAA
jgi:hypothetical protein